MIIQINATVCAAVDHGGDRQRMIAGSGQRRRGQRGKERSSEQGKQKSWEDGSNVGSSGDDDPAMLVGYGFQSPPKMAIMLDGHSLPAGHPFELGLSAARTGTEHVVLAVAQVYQQPRGRLRGSGRHLAWLLTGRLQDGG
jgi:hypothetical protein